jgi:hypothetical protein
VSEGEKDSVRLSAPLLNLIQGPMTPQGPLRGIWTSIFHGIEIEYDLVYCSVLVPIPLLTLVSRLTKNVVLGVENGCLGVEGG